jgi:hypothetical protein
VYRFKENDNVSIIHDAPFVNDEAKDRFAVCVRTGTILVIPLPLRLKLDNRLDAYYCGVVCVNNLNYDAMIMN